MNTIILLIKIMLYLYLSVNLYALLTNCLSISCQQTVSVYTISNFSSYAKIEAYLLYDVSNQLLDLDFISLGRIMHSIIC